MEMNTENALIIIPARMASGRLPGKPLLMAGGKALVHWTHDRAKETGIDRVIIATPDQEIIDYCKSNRMEWKLTRENHPTGTHRCSEVINRMSNHDYKVAFNWQVDEPLIPVKYVLTMYHRLDWYYGKELEKHPDIPVSILTLTAPIDDIKGWEWGNPDITKVVKSFQFEGICHWFSRAPMAGAVGHCGIYGFTAGVMGGMSMIQPTDLSKAESLEQLAWIESGYVIRAYPMIKLPLSINTPEDWKKFEEVIKEKENEDVSS